MASTLVRPDEWTELHDRLRFFLGVDALMVAGYRPEVRWGIDPDREELEVLTTSPMPAGWRLRFAYGGLALPPGYHDDLPPAVDTGQFRASQVDEQRLRVIGADQIRRVRQSRGELT